MREKNEGKERKNYLGRSIKEKKEGEEEGKKEEKER